ncbi:pyridoxal phosphate-dependent transferase [Podospora conica]|nr:pyridoxal phosphate-dependent transferase [Schizothecium conicum]
MNNMMEKAKQLDRDDPLAFTRAEFRIPTKAEIASTRLADPAPAAAAAADHDAGDSDADSSSCVYLCGNSLGLQPKRTATRINQYLSTWATQGVQGHFKPLDGSPLPTWLDVDDRAAELVAPIVGASPSEVAVMQTLTANLHLLMSAFYRPDPNGRHKIILESKAFPSDHFAVETQLRHHNLPPSSMVLIPSPSDNILTTASITSLITQHAATTALILLPGIQYYTGQLLDIRAITAHAHAHNIPIIWDLAHAAGNVPLALHDWDVDAAVWCSYKYLNAGPGSIGGLFVHERHGVVADDDEYRHRLAGWWGNDKRTRFRMENRFRPVSGAAGFQLSNPSVLDITSLCASLEVFREAGGVGPLREKSVRLTGFLEELLGGLGAEERAMFRIVTPTEPGERGAQLSILLAEGLLEGVMRGLEEKGVIVDERKPDVIRVAPAPLYNTFGDCVEFVGAFSAALQAAREGR